MRYRPHRFVARHKPQYQPVKKPVDVLLGLGFSLLAFALVLLIANWSNTDKGNVPLRCPD